MGNLKLKHAIKCLLIGYSNFFVGIILISLFLGFAPDAIFTMILKFLTNYRTYIVTLFTAFPLAALFYFLFKKEGSYTKPKLLIFSLVYILFMVFNIVYMLVFA